MVATPANTSTATWTKQLSTPINDGNNSGKVRGGLNTPFEVSRAANRTVGVAPLAVVFTAGFSTSSGSNRDFHDYHYLWSFDDNQGTTWATSGKDTHTDIGPVVGHVFRDPGTYTVTLSVYDSNTGLLADTDTFAITVTDPDTVFSGTNTVCISDTTQNDFTGAPAGATQVATDDLTVLNTYATSGKRVLLNRGSSWNVSSQLANFSGDSQVRIGAYGTGTSPDAQGHFANDPAIALSGSATLFSASNGNDVAISNLNVTGSTATGGFITGSENVKGLLLLDNHIVDVDIPINLGKFRDDDNDLSENNSFVNNYIDSSSSRCIYAASERLLVKGNWCTDSPNSHTMRIIQAYQSNISHNIAAGANTGDHALKLHGPSESQIGTFTETGSGGLEKRTKFCVVANNIFSSNGVWPVTIGPQNDVSDERLSDILFEKNWLLTDYNTTSPTSSTGVLIWATYVTGRNNILDFTGSSAAGVTGFTVQQYGVELAPTGVELYNNTIYSQANPTGSVTGVSMSADVTNSKAINNLIAFPNYTGVETAVSDSSTGSTVSNNLVDKTPDLTDPNNVTPLSRDYTLTVSSTAIDFGTSVPVYDDFSDEARTGTNDAGSDNY